MKTWQAGEAAARWVKGYAQASPKLRGAYLSGSYLTALRDSEWPESSDIDLMLVFPAGECPAKPGKFRESGVLLEASCLEETELFSLEHVLSTHYLAYALNAGRILYDPCGRLARLHRETARRYADRRWVEARCRGFFQKIREDAADFDSGAPLSHQVNGWAFTTGIACFPILLAALENCTVRKRFSAARRVLEQYGMEAVYPRLLALLVPEPLGGERLSVHLEGLRETFRLASGTTGPSAGYPFRSDISEEGAAVAVGGSRELIASDWPEEAVFWMLATFARCHIILAMDAPELERERLPVFRAFLADLGIRCNADFERRFEKLAEFLPELETAAAEIIRRREEKMVKKESKNRLTS